MTVDGTPTTYTQGGAFGCSACGASYLPGYPLPVGAAKALTRWWRSTHDACKPLRRNPDGSPAWTGNEHLRCSSCGRHDHLSITSVGGRPVCGPCVDLLLEVVRERHFLAQPAGL